MAQLIVSMDANEYSCRNLIKEVPNLDKWAWYKAHKLLNITGKKVEFFEMTLEECHEWIIYELGQ